MGVSGGERPSEEVLYGQQGLLKGGSRGERPNEEVLY